MCLVAMELAARLEAMSARLEAAWVPRNLNQEADALSIFDDSGFNPELRVGSLEASSIPLVVLPGMLKVATAFYEGASKATPKRPPVQTPRSNAKRPKLRERDPW